MKRQGVGAVDLVLGLSTFRWAVWTCVGSIELPFNRMLGWSERGGDVAYLWGA